jgi:hypothetical protein
MMRRSPSVGSARGDGTPGSRAGEDRTPFGTPMSRNSPSSRGGAGASPMIRRSPSGGIHGRPPFMSNQSPSSRPSSAAGAMRQHSPSVPSGGGWGGYKVGDLVEYHSSSHKDWLPATILKVDSEGRIIIDLKPNTWITKEEQTTKVRRRGLQPANRPSSRCESPVSSPSLHGRRPSSVDRGYASPLPAAGLPRGSGTPRSRCASPVGSCGGAHRLPGIAARDCGLGMPRQWTPGIPPRAAASPLRSGGRSVVCT